jgi:uncharacterized membrane protein
VAAVGATGVSLPARHAATKSFFFCPPALIAALLAAYSALHCDVVLPPATAVAGAGAGGGAAAGAAADPPGTVSVPARQAAMKSVFFCPAALIASLLDAYSALQAETVFANEGEVDSAIAAAIPPTARI